MARRKVAKTKINTPLQPRKGSQRERLLNGMVTAANRDGYSGASVSAVIAEAGVSRPTFYDYFADREACFLAAIVELRDRLQQSVSERIAEVPAEQAAAAAVEATVSYAREEPANARFLMKESLAGGPAALDMRDAGIAATAHLIERALAKAEQGVAIPDIPLQALIGSLHRLLATRLRRNERVLDGLLEDLQAWVASYATPAGTQRWTTMERRPPAPPSPFLPRTTPRPPPRLGPGRPRMPAEEVAENHRQRIMFATGVVVAERGYNAATITDITRRAGVDAREFYRLYGDKQEAFSAIHELGFQYLMAVTAGAFFAGSSWPERIWEAYRAAIQSVQENPAVSVVGFVESYAVGARGIERVEDIRVAFAIFLQEGYRCEPAVSPPPPQLALEAIMTSIFEIVYGETRAAGTQPRTSGFLADVVHLCLTPFMGAQAANAFIDSKLAELPGQRKKAAASPASKRKAPAQARRSPK